MTETISNQLKLSEHIQMEIKDELSNFNQELIEDSIESFYFIEENGNKSINIENVNSFLEKIKNQDWKEMTNSNQDKLWTTAVQIKLVSLGYNI